MHPQEQILHPLVGCCLDFLQIGEYRLDTFGIASRRVHGLVVDRSYFECHSPGFGIGGSKVEHDLFDTVLGGVVEYVELTVAGIFLRQGMCVLPSFCNVMVEVVLGDIELSIYAGLMLFRCSFSAFTAGVAIRVAARASMIFVEFII